MKALLLVEDDSKALEVERHLKPLGFEAIRYRNPVKALDNLEEIEPDLIIASALDFPRHWKIIADVVRAAKSRRECIIILLRGEHFGIEEADKASHLEVNGIISEDLADPSEQARFLHVLRRYATIKDARIEERIPASPWDRILFLFSHPKTTRILGGRVLTISLTGLSIELPEPQLLSDLVKGTRLDDCSLRLGSHILALTCTIARIENTMGLAFGIMSAETRQILASYLAGSAQREMRARAHEYVDKS